MFEFDEASHTYRLDGVVLPSVTTIIRPLVDFSAVPPDVLQRAALYGTAVHKTIELYLTNDLDESSLDDGLVKPLEAFKRWQDDYPDGIGNWCAIERRMYHRKFKFAGTADIITEGRIIDIKTRPACVAVDSIQLAAYDMLWTNEHGNEKFDHRILELKQDGTYNYPTVKRAGAREKFRYLLDFYRMSETIQKWRKSK